MIGASIRAKVGLDIHSVGLDIHSVGLDGIKFDEAVAARTPGATEVRPLAGPLR